MARSAIGVAVGLLAGLAAAQPANAREQTLTAADGVRFGSSVAMDADTIVVGSPGTDDWKGAVYVFERSGDGWEQSAKLTASDGADGDSLGGGVAIDGDTIVAGATGAEDDRGAVYAFTRCGRTDWTETARLTAADGDSSDWLGSAVGIDGNTIVAGAPGNDDDTLSDGGNIGAVYTFSRAEAAGRTETAKLIASDRSGSDELGASVAIDGDTIVAGTDYADYDEQAVYTFARTGAPIRTETARLTASDGGWDYTFGDSVAIDGDTIAVGAEFVPGGGGAIYLFARSGEVARTETAKLTASDAGTEWPWRLGSSVAIDGDMIVAGAVGAAFDDDERFQGAVYGFARDGAPLRHETARWTALDGAENDLLGNAVAIDGDTIVAGSVGVNFGDDNPGSARVFDRGPPDVTPPETRRLIGPRKVRKGRNARFRFGSNESASTFVCRLDRRAYEPCTSPLRLGTGDLKVGRHRLLVRTIDGAGNRDASPARTRFRVMRARGGGVTSRKPGSSRTGGG